MVEKWLDRLPTDPALYIPIWWKRKTKMMKMNEKKKSKNRRPRYQLQSGPHMSVVYRARSAWNEANLAGSAWDIFDPYPTETMFKAWGDRELWTTVCKKETKKLILIKTELFPFRFKSVYKCTTKLCTVVHYKVVPASSYYWEVFPAWHLQKHGRSLFVPLRYPFKVEPGISTSIWKDPFYILSH